MRKDGKIFFYEFDFEDVRFITSNSLVQEIYRKAYKSKMNQSTFIELMSHVKSRSRKSRNRSAYRNAHKMSETYQHLDDRFNFFGNYDYNPQ